MAQGTTQGPFVHIDRETGVPLQQQVYDAIRHAILGGTIHPGARVMSSRALAVEFGISRTTTLLAFDQLSAEGYLVARHGSGTFVASDLPDEAPRRPQTQTQTRDTLLALSSRGARLAALRPAADRLRGPSRPFRIGVPALDCFPLKTWTALVTRRLRRATRMDLDYGDPAGALPLRVAIAAHVQAARGTRCSASQVIVTAGAQRGLELVCHALLDAGDDVWMEEPGYPGARSAFVAAGAAVRALPVDEEGLDIARAAQARARPRLAYVTPSHQFPLGVAMSLPRRRALIAWAQRTRAWIVEDDYDNEFRYGRRPVPCLHGLDADGRVIYTGSFSKTLFPALRLGFLIVPTALHASLVAVRRAADLHPQTIDQLALADFIAEGHYERHLRRMRAVYRERVDALVDAAARSCAGLCTVRPVHAGLHAVVDLRPGLDAVCVAREAAARGVEVMPLAAYYEQPRRASGEALVLGFGSVAPSAVREGMRRLAQAILASALR